MSDKEALSNINILVCTTGYGASIMVEKGEYQMCVNTVCRELLCAGGGQAGAIVSERRLQ